MLRRKPVKTVYIQIVQTTIQKFTRTKKPDEISPGLILFLKIYNPATDNSKTLDKPSGFLPPAVAKNF